ncbi:CaiB/BaiF CoA transferase family protein [Cupriavidus alkaliphilus]|uniref:CaiB/BaiF CoA transferase family protein n=1 Tax=Cupriavidus alkaliphilus TaxID=942866 RepID=UPI0016189400|nr:CoA transferase [Cupriavidus alkaliphilus]MBB3014115.1 crotonobetainyl-CoA:carnitine CoA-transferase CaiB-like acyl-CoA transferase [Cupriavidus alkaliphilus]
MRQNNLNTEQKATMETQQQTEALPLTGVRVLDLGHVFQGPYATFLMAMAGAEVIKIEPPHGDMSRNRGRDGDYPFRALNGCKRGIVLNLKTERGRELLLELARSADVLVENFAPGVMPRLGLGADVLQEVNPRLIYASASGFGRTGPYADKLALDLTIQAMSGMMSTTGEKGGRPLKAGVPVADFMSGATLYGAIVTALFERERTGRGRALEVSMLESLFATLLPSAGHVYASNKVPQRTGNRHVADSYVPFDTFEASDGWVAIVAATDEHWLNLTEAMDRPDLRDDPHLRKLAGRIERIDELTEEIARWAAEHTRDQVTELLQKHHVPSAPLRYVNEVLADPHLRARGFLTDHDTANGTVALPNSPIRYQGSPLRPLSAPPTLGQHTDDVLAELCGLDADQLAQLRRDGVTV